MVDITSLKARLARLRLGSEFDDKHPDLADPVTKERKERKDKKTKTLSGWSYGRDAKVRKAQDPYNQYTTNTGGKRKKKNKLTRSDQKRGKKKRLPTKEELRRNTEDFDSLPPDL